MEPLQEQVEQYLAVIRPFTHQLPEPLVKLGSQIIGPLAFQRLVLDLDLFADDSMELLKQSLSKLIGLGIISASSIVKLPQIFTIMKSQNVNGLSFLSYALEALNYIITSSYNFRQGNPFSTFGETALLFLQNVAIMVLIIGYKRQVQFFQLFFTVLALAVYLLFAPAGAIGSFSDSWVSKLFTLTIPLSILSKFPQIYNNYKAKSTGQMSGFSVLNYNIGTLARIFTTLASHVNDNVILAGYILGGILNFILAVQMIQYRANGNKRKVKTQ